MILTGNEIKLQREAGNIIISDWDETRLGPNSYNLRLSPELVAYAESAISLSGMESQQKGRRKPHDKERNSRRCGEVRVRRSGAGLWNSRK